MISPELSVMLARLRREGYFNKPRSPTEVHHALVAYGHWFTEDQIAAALDEMLANQ